jgi:hypothetical protein
MKPTMRRKQPAQAWIDLCADDPVAVSALAVARAHLEAGRGLLSLRRFRVFELLGTLPDRAEVSELLHRSSQFYNPHKEGCRLRMEPTDAVPAAAGEQTVLVFERDGERRPAAERWWRHETGRRIEVREGTAFVLRFEPSVDAAACTAALAVVSDRSHGLLCNPNAEEFAVAGADIPLRWMSGPKPRRRTRSLS